MSSPSKTTTTRYLALDVGGTTTKAGIVAATGEVLALNSVESHAGGSRTQVLADIHWALAPFANEPAAGLGAGFPSFGDFERGVLDSAVSGYPSMHGFPLRQYLEDAYGLPTRTVSDASLFAHGILRFGEGRRLSDFIAIGLGTGPAIGLVRAGQVLTGPRGFPDVVLRFYTEYGWPAAHRHSGFHFAELYGADPQTTHRRALAGDAAALRAWRQVGEALAETIFRLSAESGIRDVVIGGGLANAWEFFEPALRRRLQIEGICAGKTALPNPSLAGAAALFLVQDVSPTENH